MLVTFWKYSSGAIIAFKSVTAGRVLSATVFNRFTVFPLGGVVLLAQLLHRLQRAILRILRLQRSYQPGLLCQRLLLFCSLLVCQLQPVRQKRVVTAKSDSHSNRSARLPLAILFIQPFMIGSGCRRCFRLHAGCSALSTLCRRHTSSASVHRTRRPGHRHSIFSASWSR